MPTPPNNELFLYDFFTRLREEVRIELDHTQYTLLLRALYLKPLNFENWQEELFALCQLLWLPSLAYKTAFSNLYRQHIHEFMLRQEERTELKRPSVDSDESKNLLQPGNGTDDQAVSEPVSTKEANSPAQRTSTQPGSSTSSDEAPAQWPEINLRVKDTSRPQDSPSNETDGKSRYKEIPFSFSASKSIPFKIRTATQYWRKLKSPQVKKLTDIIDIERMIRQYTKDGFFSEPQFQQKTVGRQQVVWLSDHGGSMTPFLQWENAFMEVLNANPHIAGIEQYFFHDYPSPAAMGETDFLLFTNPAHTNAVNLSGALSKKRLGPSRIKEIFRKQRADEPGITRQKWNKKTLIILYSDGGAARRRQDFDRVEAFMKLVLLLKQSCKRMLWINPVKKTNDTSAMFISYFVQMISPDLNDMRRAIANL